MALSKRKQERGEAAARNRYIRDIQRIHCLVRDLGIERDLYEDILMEIIGRRSVKDADGRERRLVIEHLERIRKNLDGVPAGQLAGTGPRERGRTHDRYLARGTAGDDGPFPTQKQLNYIAYLEDIAGWTENPDRLLGFIRRQTGGITYMPSSMPRDLATKVINGLGELTGYTPRKKKTAPRRQTARNAKTT